MNRHKIYFIGRSNILKDWLLEMQNPCKELFSNESMAILVCSLLLL